MRLAKPGFTLIWLLPLISALLPAARVYAHPLTDLVNQAYQSSPAIKIAQESLQIADKELSNSKSAFLPTLNLNSSHGLAKNHYGAITDPWTSNVGLALNHNLYDNHRSINQYRIQTLKRESAEASLRQAKNQIALEIARTYFTWSLAVENAAVKATGLGLFEKQYRFVESQYQQGIKPKKDFLKFRAQWERAVLGDTSAKAGIAQARFALLAKMGMDPLDQKALTPFVPVVDVKSIPVEKPQIEKNWTYRTADLELRIRPIEMNLASREFWPQINLIAGGNYSNTNYLNSGARFGDTETYGVSLQLQLNYNILDWGVRGRNIDIASHRKNIEAERLRETALKLTEEAASLMVELTRLKQAYEVAESVYKNEEESYQATQRDYREGKVNSYDFINYVRDYLEGKTLYLNSRYDLWNAILRYHYLTGELDEHVAKL